MAKVKFTKDIIGSPNGILVNEYKAGQIVSDADLGEYLLKVWTEAGIVEEVDVDVDVDVKGDLKDDNSDKDKDEENDNDKDKDNDKELTEEKIGQLVYDATAILEKEEMLEDEDIAKLKEIGIELKIDGMKSSKKPQTIVDKINAYIDEYNGEDEDEDEDEEEDIPEEDTEA